MNAANISKLLKDTKRVLKHQKEIAILKGETFNVFSILKMESSENATHSAFLGALLNPKGDHHLGVVFLHCFLEQLGVKDHIDLKTAQVKLEYHIGKRDDKLATGGRVDIFIFDGNGHTICVENKIYASDQDVQIARYCNYNQKNNKVFYLNLEGTDPDPKSVKDKIDGKDFTIISYAFDIIEWLELCVKEAVNSPIIRESINQYSILIKKLTNQLSNHNMEKEIQDIIVAHYKEARTIGSNIGKIELEYTELFLKEVAEQTQSKLSDLWDVQVDSDLNKTWTGICIYHKNWPKKIHIKLEGASKVPWNNSIYGVKIQKKDFNRLKVKEALSSIELLQHDFKESEVWPYYKTILNFSSVHERSKLFKPASRKELVSSLSSELATLCLLCEEPISGLANVSV